MILEKAHEEKILDAVHKAVESVDHGEVQIKIDKTKPILDIVVVTQERVRLEKTVEK